MATILTEKAKLRKGNTVKIVAGILLSLAVVVAVGRVVAPNNNAGVSQSNTPSIAESVDYQSLNQQTIVVGPDGQKVIENSYDGSLVNFDGSPYTPMLTTETAGLVESMNNAALAKPARVSNQNQQTIVIGPDGQSVIQFSNGSMVNLDGSTYIPMPTEQLAGDLTRTSVLKTVKVPAQNYQGIMVWIDGEWVIPDPYVATP